MHRLATMQHIRDGRTAGQTDRKQYHANSRSRMISSKTTVYIIIIIIILLHK